MSASVSYSLHVGNISDPSHIKRIAEIASRGLICFRRYQFRKSAGTQNILTGIFVNFLSPSKHMPG
jgi:hypothetical protein